MADEEVGRLKVTLGLDGTGFQDGISKVNRQLKIVESEFAVAAAKLGDFGDASDKLGVKAKSLSKQIEIQQAKVDLLRNAVAKSAAEKGEDARQTDLLTIKYNKAAAKLANMENALNRTNKELQENATQLKDVSHQAQKTDSVLRQLGSTIKQAFLFSGVYGGIYALTSAMKNAIGAGVQYDAQMQQEQIAFTTLLGSAGQAKDMLNQIADFAQRTPFDTTGVEQAATQMMAMGFAAQDILPDMKKIGDAAAALGLQSAGIQRLTLALGQLRSHGTVDAQDMLQLTEAGIPAWQMLADSMGKTIPQVKALSQKGLIPAKQATDALIADMEAKYPNMLQKLNSSFSSEMGNLGDSFKRTFGDLITPEFNQLTETILPSLNAKLDTFRKTLEESGASAAFKTLIPPSVVDSVNALSNGIKSLFHFIKEYAPGIETALAGIAAFKLGSMFANLSGVTRFVKAMKDAAKAGKDAATAENALTKSQVALNLVMGKLGFGNYIQRVKELRKETKRMAIVQAAWDAAMDANPIGVIVMGLAALTAAVVGAYEAWKHNWGGIQQKTKAVVDVIKSYFILLVKGVETEFYALESGVITIVEGIMKIVQPVVGLIGRIAPGFEAGFKNAETAIDNARKNSVDKMTNALNQTKDAAEQLAQAGRDVAASFRSASNAAASLPAGVSEGADGVPVFHAHATQQELTSAAPKQAAKDTVSATDKALQDAMKSAKAKASNAGKSIVQSFMNGVNSKLAPLQNMINQLQARIQFRTDQGNTDAVKQADIQLADAYKQQMDGLQRAMASVNAEVKKMNPRTQAADISQLKDQYSQLATKWWNARDALVKLNQSLANTKKALEKIQSKAWKSAADAFNKIASQDVTSINTALQNELSAMKTAHQNALTQFDQVTAAADAQFKARLNALQQQSTNNSRANRQSQWDTQMGGLQHQLSVANLMGDTSTINQVKQQIDQLNQQISQQKKAWAIQDQQQAIQQQQQQYDAQRARQKKALAAQYADLEAEKQKEITLEKQKFTQLQTQLVSAVQTGKLTQQQANAAWVKAINDTGDEALQAQIKNQQKTQKQLDTWVQSYIDIGRSYGKGLGDGVVAGLQSSLSAVRVAAAQLKSAASVAVGAGRTAVASATTQIKVPALAKGGIFNGPALIGEAGPEAAIPLNDSTLSRLAAAIMKQAPRSGVGDITIPVYLDSQVIGSYVWNAATGQLQEASRKGV